MSLSLWIDKIGKSFLLLYDTLSLTRVKSRVYTLFITKNHY